MQNFLVLPNTKIASLKSDDFIQLPNYIDNFKFTIYDWFTLDNQE